MLKSILHGMLKKSHQRRSRWFSRPHVHKVRSRLCEGSGGQAGGFMPSGLGLPRRGLWRSRTDRLFDHPVVIRSPFITNFRRGLGWRTVFQHPVRRSFLLLLLLPLLGGCLPSAQTEPAKFYLLRTATEVQPQPAMRKVSVGIGPVDLPQYLDRPQIVTQTAGNELEINEFHRWAEPLQDNFIRVMANDVGLLLGTDEVFVFPWRSAVAIDFQVKVEVTAFIGQLGGESSLVARWSVIGDDGRKVLLRQRSQLRARASGTYEGLVTAMNETLTKLSREIADAIRSLPRK